SIVPATAARAAAADTKAKRHHRGRPAARGRDIAATGSVPTATGSMCGARVEAVALKPIVRLEQLLDINDAQRASLQAVRDAVTEAVRRGKGACLDALRRAPTARLKAAADALWAMRDTDILLRTPLANFYAALTDAQKAKLADAFKKDGDKPDDGGVAA